MKFNIYAAILALGGFYFDLRTHLLSIYWQRAHFWRLWLAHSKIKTARSGLETAGFSGTIMRHFLLILFSLFLAVAQLEAAKPLANVCTAALSKSDSQKEVDQIVAELDGRRKVPEKFFTKYSLESIAKALVKRQKGKGRAYRTVKVNMRKSSQVMLFFEPKNINRISRHGFLNMYQSLTTNGFNLAEKRLKLEDKLFDIQLGTSDAAKYLRPKYAFLNFDIGQYVGSRRSSVRQQYGSVAAVMKEKVKDRSVWVAGDSFQLLSKYFDYPTEMQRVSGTFDDNLYPKGPGEPWTRQPDPLDVGAYDEVMILGHVDLEDVDYFLASTQAEALQLKKLGKDVYELVEEHRNARIYYTRGKKFEF